MVKGGDSSEGFEFKCRHRILDGHFFTIICYKICIVCLIRPKINEKEAEDCPFFKKEVCIVNYDASVVSKATFQQVQLGEECLDIGPICSQY